MGEEALCVAAREDIEGKVESVCIYSDDSSQVAWNLASLGGTMYLYFGYYQRTMAASNSWLELTWCFGVKVGVADNRSCEHVAAVIKRQYFCLRERGSHVRRVPFVDCTRKQARET